MSQKQRIEDVAELACLKIDDSEAEDFQLHFNKILHYVAVMDELDTQGVEPMVTPHDFCPPLREDVVVQDLTVEEVLSNAPDVKDSLFKVPPVV